MCIIIFAENGQIPKSHLKESLGVNPHGWGFMQPDGDGSLQIIKGMGKAQFWKHWRQRRKEVPTVFHARFATHGKRDCDTCHPFAIPGHPGLGVAHNGILTKHADDKSELSDTQIFIKKILAHLPKGFTKHSGVKKLMEEYIGYNKLVFLNSKGEVTFINEKLGHWSNNRWYSNYSYVVATKQVGQYAFNATTRLWELVGGAKTADTVECEIDCDLDDAVLDAEVDRQIALEEAQEAAMKDKPAVKHQLPTAEPEWYKDLKRRGGNWPNNQNYHVT